MDDRNKIAKSQYHEVRRFAMRFGLTTGEVHDLVDKLDGDRVKMEEAARQLNAQRGREVPE